MTNNSTTYYHILIIGLFLFLNQFGFSQSQKKADSLREIYLNNSKNGVDKFELLIDLSFNSIANLDESIAYANELIQEAKKEPNHLYLYHGYNQRGQTYRMFGDYEDALESFLKACGYANNLENQKYLGVGYSTIADVYSEIGNSDNSTLYYQKAINILRETNDSLLLAGTLLNSGYDKYLNSDFDKALMDYKESSVIYKTLDYAIGSAYNIGNIGMVYAEQGKDQIALENITEAVNILEESDNFEAISEYLTSMSDIYEKQGEIEQAIVYDQRSLDLANKYKLKRQISESNLSLSELYKLDNNWENAYLHFNEGIKYRDSIRNLEVIEEMADQRTNFEVSQEQDKTIISEQKRKNQRILLWSTIGILLLIGVLAYNLFKKNKFVRATNKIIETEKDRSDKLLLNILPAETAQELKDKGRVEAKKFPSVTVLFSDFKGFTSYAENLSPEKLVETIDHYFSKFDLIMEKHGLEKIKTIGDAYMAVGGLSYDNVDQAKEMVLAAKEMNDFVNQAKIDDATTAEFDIRIGINTGPVVAGVVGTKKFAYDIWGDTVNIASRMESNSKPGRINISEDTYNILKSEFDCEYRGELDVKNRGSMKMYFVNS